MRLLAISGSLRKDSLNTKLARAAARLAPAGVEVDVVTLHGLPMYDEDLHGLGTPEPVAQLAARVRAADVVLIVTPEYNYSIPGVLKNAIDWLSRLPDTPFAGKPLAIQSASMGGLGGARAQYHLRQTLVFLDAMVLNKPEIMIGVVQNKVDSVTGKLVDADTCSHIGKQLSALAALIEKLAR